MMYYLTRVFPQSLVRVDQRLRDAWSYAGFDPEQLEGHKTLPQIRFGDWVGGDRDGHPFVTSEVTEETLHELRRQSLQLHAQDLDQLAAKLSFTDTRGVVPDQLKKKISEISEAHW